MNYITFFSTKIFREGSLFYQAKKLDSEEIKEYFRRQIPEEIIPPMTSETWWLIFQKYHFSEEQFIERLKASVTTPSEDDITLEEIIEEFKEGVKATTPDNEQQITRDFYELHDCIGSCLNELRSSRNAELEKKRQDFIDERSKVYALDCVTKDNDTYFSFAIPALKNGEGAEDENNGWIPSLCSAAQALSGSMDGDFEIRLVLHDKDLGGEYKNNDVYILNDVARYISNPKVKIVFFKHTSNDFVRVILKKHLSSLEVFNHIKSAIDAYEKQKEIVEFLDSFPYVSKDKVKLALTIEELKNSNN